MATAKLAAMRSKDPKTKVGACIVNVDKRIVGVGYNGMPKGIDTFPWQTKGIKNKYKYVLHAEINAVLNSIANLQGCTIYVTLFPCNECAKVIVQAGIKKLVYGDNKYQNEIDTKISLEIFKVSNVLIQEIKLARITI